LSVLAAQLGFATSARKPPRPVHLDGNGTPDLNDPSLHADVGDLANAHSFAPDIIYCE
jgi:hypothetical protein